MNRRIVALVLAAACAPQVHAQGRVITLPRDLELRLAVNALPKPLREQATVLVLEPAWGEPLPRLFRPRRDQHHPPRV